MGPLAPAQRPHLRAPLGAGHKRARKRHKERRQHAEPKTSNAAGSQTRPKGGTTRKKGRAQTRGKAHSNAHSATINGEGTSRPLDKGRTHTARGGPGEKVGPERSTAKQAEAKTRTAWVTPQARTSGQRKTRSEGGTRKHEKSNQDTNKETHTHDSRNGGRNGSDENAPCQTHRRDWKGKEEENGKAAEWHRRRKQAGNPCEAAKTQRKRGRRTQRKIECRKHFAKVRPQQQGGKKKKISAWTAQKNKEKKRKTACKGQHDNKKRGNQKRGNRHAVESENTPKRKEEENKTHKRKARLTQKTEKQRSRDRQTKGEARTRNKKRDK
ncbi:hypothetical protein, conserved in T. vivax [Trypanosoma vivax Y486]|uniref:Uncharacterized protein n=1 Tax=Trypanosoma vivax (strain Y486) TaxID=1055687 RepID=F9WNS6_TRYVY|nr:hypothetical protein, conserved in T. vivax [Trypanosoma vivax Y486]|eukprot:CCD19197.1 hypothetical protein, conserved in T. vivax [Trypanosoma vivax Y486]